MLSAIAGVPTTAKSTIPSKITTATTTTTSITQPTPMPSKLSGQNNFQPHTPKLITSSWATYTKKSTCDSAQAVNSSSSMNSTKITASPPSMALTSGPKTSNIPQKKPRHISRLFSIIYIHVTLILNKFVYEKEFQYSP